MSCLKRAIVVAAFALAAMAGSLSHAAAQDRLALVVGQGAYEGRLLPTTVNDAGLIAQSLTSAGFEVVQGRDLNGNDLRRLVRDFLDKAQNLEPGSTVMVYLAGQGIQLEGENYLIPVDARIRRDGDIPLEGFRLSDLVRSLEQTPSQTRVIVADMARDYPLASTGEPIARGLALIEPPAGFLIAFSSAPNSVAPEGQGPYGAYATALAETIRQPGLPLDEVFGRVRLRTHDATNGSQTPWHAANLDRNASFVFFEAAEASSAPLVREVRRIEEVPAEEAYNIAVERDTIQDYQTFLRRYPEHPLARRVTALLSARREAVVWRRTLSRNTREAYWTYLRRYPNGPHAADSRRRLARLAAPYAPPSDFEEVVYEDLPPPLPVETVEVVTIIRDAPPPPPPPVYLLPPRDEDDEEFVTIIREPPPPPVMAGVLPIPVPIPVPVRARPPRSFYQPIAPVTPRGPVAIPVAAPPVLGALFGDPRAPRPRHAPRPEQPRVPQQPGLAAPVQPLPVSVDTGSRPPRGARPETGPDTRPVRLPARPIPLSGSQPEAPRPRPEAVQPEPAGRGNRPMPLPTARLPEPSALPAAPGEPRPLPGRPARPDRRPFEAEPRDVARPDRLPATMRDVRPGRPETADRP